MSLFKWLIKLINFLIIAAVLLTGAAASLFWLPTGRTVIKPALNYVNENYLQPLKVDIKEIDGTLYQGYSLKDLKIFSGDELYISLDYAALSPDWEALLSKKPLMKLVKLFELDGLSADANNLLNIANYFTSSEDDSSESNLNPADILAPININVNRVNINNILAVINEADKLDFSLNNLSLNESGDVNLKSNLILNNKNILPVDLDAEINFADLEILKSKFKIGQGVGAVKGGLKDLRADLTAFKLDDFMPLAKIFIKDEESLNASGRIDGRIFLKNLD
ncbi:MAG: hypothetical protein IJG62_04625, partial [Synergistaceae bacterium]|nr:hypothetical protein [Synergistaceae bacterium]